MERINNPVLEDIVLGKNVVTMKDVVKSPRDGFNERQAVAGPASSTEKQKFDAIQSAGTTRMQSTAGLFETSSGTTTIAYFAERSTSGVVRGGSAVPAQEKPSHANNYTTITINSAGRASAIVGAAQGLKEVFDEVKGKFKKSEDPRIYKEEALYQMAQAIVAAQKAQQINQPGQPTESPSVIMIGNYMSKSSKSFVGKILGALGFGTDDKTIKVREEVISEMSSKGLDDRQLQKLKGYVKELGGNSEVIQKIGGNDPQSIPLVFNQQGLNSARAASQNSDNRIVEIARQHIQTKPDPIIEQLIQAIDNAKQKIESTKGFSSEVAAIISAKNSDFAENTELHQEALKIVLVQQMGGAFVGGCQSAKDRFGALATLARTYDQYIAETGQIPPVFGSKEYNEDTKIQERMDRIFAEQWMSGVAQFIASSNTPGAFGLKNNEEILTNGQRQAIERAVAAKIKDDPSQKDIYISFLPSVSHKLAGLNKLDDVADQKKLFEEEIESKANKILKKAGYKASEVSSFSNGPQAPRPVESITSSEISSEKAHQVSTERPSLSTGNSMSSGALSKLGATEPRHTNKLGGG